FLIHRPPPTPTLFPYTTLFRSPGALTEYARPHPGPFVPQAFTQEEFAVVRRLVEIILGEDLKNASERLAPGAPASIYDEVAEWRSEEHTSELQSRSDLVCRLLL